MTEFPAVLHAASQLSVADRLRLIDDLSSTVADDNPPELSIEWIQEIERRAAEIDRGKVVCKPWSDVRQQVFGRFGIDHAD